MKIGLIESHYLPSLEFFAVLLQFDKIILDYHEHFVKQSYRNRCYINTAQGPAMLVVPLKERHGRIPFMEVRIDYGLKWQNNHWRSIQSAYAKAPFFEHYQDELYKVLYSGTPLLADLNRFLLSFCLQNVGLRTEVSETVAYEKVATAEICDLRSQISPKTPFSERSYYQPKPYYQVFGNTFAGNLSLIDLLFCVGPGSLALLRGSRKVN